MKNIDPIFSYINQEEERQKNSIELIASENFVSSNVLRAMGSILTNKYAEGYPKNRYYGGCEFIDKIEQTAIDRAKKLFEVEYVNVQPHSGSQANAAVFLACLNSGDSILGFDISHGGHLTHGAKVNFSGKIYKSFSYGISKESGLIDYKQLEEIANKVKPKLIICGASAYCRDIDYKKFREIANQVNAILLADIAHPAGLIAKKLLNDPKDHCHILTTTTHKTLRGPRGGMIMIGKDFENPFGKKDSKGNLLNMSKLIDLALFPGIQGGPLEHIIAAKAIGFEENLNASYANYTSQIIKNAKKLANCLIAKDYQLISGGTDNHCILIDLGNKKITGKEAEKILEKASITTNKNLIPFDEKSPFITSGIRLGTAAITTRGLKETQMEYIAAFIDEVILNKENERKIQLIKEKVNKMMEAYPLFSY